MVQTIPDSFEPDGPAIPRIALCSATTCADSSSGAVDPGAHHTVNNPSQDHAGEDAALLAAVAHGDIDAPMAELYQRYAHELYFLGLKRLLDHGLAEELVQETFMRLWRRAKKFNPTRGRVSDYLFTIAASTAADLRRRPSSTPHAREPHPDTLVDEDRADQLAEALTIREALDSLTPAHREVLTLAHAEDLTHRQIADRLNIPLGTVKTRFYHGLRAFRRALEDRGAECEQ